MLIKLAQLDKIRRGEVTVAFRRWKRPTVKAGGTLLTAVGRLAIEAVEPVRIEELTAGDAQDAGFDGLEALRRELEARDGQCYRIRLSFAGEDPRIALRNEIPNASAVQEILDRLRRRDVRAADGPWTRAVLELIAGHPSTRAGDLAPVVGMELARFKSRVRGLKALGLTISEGVGYRLSPRGEAILEALSDRAGSE